MNTNTISKVPLPLTLTTPNPPLEGGGSGISEERGERTREGLILGWVGLPVFGGGLTWGSALIQG